MTITTDRHGWQRQRRTFRTRQAYGKLHTERSSAYTRHMPDSCRHRRAELSGTPDFQSSDVCLSVAAPGDIPSKPEFHPGLTGRKAGCTQAKQGVKEGIRAIMAGVAWRNSPHYAHYKAGFRRHWAKKQQLKLAGREGLFEPRPGYSSRQSRFFCAHQRHSRMRL